MSGPWLRLIKELRRRWVFRVVPLFASDHPMYSGLRQRMKLDF